MKTTYFYITLFSSLILFIGCEKDKDSDEPTSISGCTAEEACNYNAEATDDDGSCWYELSNPIEFTYIEDNVSGPTGDDINAYIDIRNASCETSMLGLQVSRQTANPVPDEIYFTFCIAEYCYATQLMSLSPLAPAQYPLDLAPGQETNDITRFKSTLFSTEPGVYQVTYRFFQFNTAVMREQTITYTVN